MLTSQSFSTEALSEISVAILAIPHRFVKSSIEIFVIQAVQSGQTQNFFE